MFTYVKSARFAFSRSGISRASRSSAAVPAPRFAQLRRGGDDDDLVEARLRTDLVEERHLRDADLRRVGSAASCSRHVMYSRETSGWSSFSRKSSASRSLKTRWAMRSRSGRRPRPRISSPSRSTRASLHVRIRGEEVVDDLVARHGRCAMAAKALERRRLAGADPAGDRDRERARQALVGVGLLGAGLDGLLLRTLVRDLGLGFDLGLDLLELDLGDDLLGDSASAPRSLRPRLPRRRPLPRPPRRSTSATISSAASSARPPRRRPRRRPRRPAPRRSRRGRAGRRERLLGEPAGRASCAPTPHRLRAGRAGRPPRRA